MSDPSSMSGQKTSLDLRNVIFSLEFPGGVSPCNTPDGLPTNLCGQDRALASPSQSPESEKEQPTRDISGQNFGDSSRSAILQRSLENRLRAKTDVNGSLEYVLTWKHWDMASGHPICALRARARHTFDSGYTGWPTPVSRDGFPAHTPEYIAEKKALGHGMANLNDVAQTAGWPTPLANKLTPQTREDFTPNLAAVAETVAGWRTPDHNERGGDYSDPEKALKRLESGHQVNLADQAVLSGWATPTSRDHKDGSSVGTTPINGLLGRQVWGTGTDANLSSVPTEKRGALNHHFSRWLMGFPKQWTESALVALSNLKAQKSKQLSEMREKRLSRSPQNKNTESISCEVTETQ